MRKGVTTDNRKRRVNQIPQTVDNAKHNNQHQYDAVQGLNQFNLGNIHQKLTFVQLVTSSQFLETKFTAIFTRPNHWNQSWAI